MNKNIKNLFFACCACFAFLTINSCGEEATLDGTIDIAKGARVKFFHAASGGAPLIVTQNGQKWTSVLSTAKYTDSVVYSGTYPAIDYTVLPAGQTKFEAKQPLTVDATGKVISELTHTLEDGKYHLLVAADTFPTPKLYMIPDIRDDARNSNKTYFRFTNFLVKSPTTGYEVYLSRQKDKAFATLKYGEASPYIEFEPTGNLTDTVFLREPGKTTNFATFGLGSSKFAANVSYMVVLRGVVGGTSTKVPSATILRTN